MTASRDRWALFDERMVAVLLAVLLACGDQGPGQGGDGADLSQLAAPGPNEATVMLDGDGLGNGSDPSDVPEGRTDTYIARLDDFGTQLPSVIFDNAAGLGHGYALFEFADASTVGTQSTGQAGVAFRWNSPGGQTFFPVGPCDITITSPWSGAGSVFRGETACPVTSGGFTFTVLVKFHRVDP